MTHSIGEVIVDGETVAYFDYNGSVDVAVSHLVKTSDEIEFREMPWLDCECEGQDAILYTSYGDGFHWPAKVCLEHRTIVSDRRAFDACCDGTLCRRYGCEHWPKDGHPIREL